MLTIRLPILTSRKKKGGSLASRGICFKRLHSVQFDGNQPLLSFFDGIWIPKYIVIMELIADSEEQDEVDDWIKGREKEGEDEGTDSKVIPDN